MKHNIRKFLAVASCSLAATLVVCFAILAWTEPGAVPPGGNVAVPLNTGGIAQSKVGDLSIGSGLKYWITKEGDSFALKNNAGINQLKVGQDGNVVATAKVSTPSMCLGSDCRTSWPAAAAQSCSAGQTVTGIGADGKIICGTAGNANLYFKACNQIVLPAGNKRIFVTEGTGSLNSNNGGWLSNACYENYNGGWSDCSSNIDTNWNICRCFNIDDETNADKICQMDARYHGLPGTYKALVHYKTRNPRDVLPAGNAFWNLQSVNMAPGITSDTGEIVRGACFKRLIAANPDDFFTNDGNGNYLQNTISFTESGQLIADSGYTSTDSVWTGFNADGTFSGRITTSSPVGSLTKKTSAWASGSVAQGLDEYYRHLYCVEQ